MLMCDTIFKARSSNLFAFLAEFAHVVKNKTLEQWDPLPFHS